jgi:acyl-CoA reductase-like NAD-dependent aldehyde dehydrogenase
MLPNNLVQSEQEGVSLANACKYGLGAGIWTSDLSRAHRVAADVESGLCWVNTHHRNDPSSPWYSNSSLIGICRRAKNDQGAE